MLNHLRHAIARYPVLHRPARALKQFLKRGRRQAASSLPPQRLARRILVCDFRMPRPASSAGDLGALGVTLDLKRIGFDVTFLAWNMETAGPDRHRLDEAGVTVVSRQVCKSPLDFIARHAADFGTFYLFRFEIAEQLIDEIRWRAPRARVIFHDPDLVFLRLGRERELLGGAATGLDVDAIRERELAVMRKADRTILVSPFEIEAVRALEPDLPLRRFAHLYVPVAPPLTAAKPQCNALVFVGGFQHRPNLDAVEWFVAQCWPAIMTRLPDAEFWIVGPDAPASLLALDDTHRIRVLGPVEDLARLLSEAMLSIAPLRYGAGIKGKVAYALASGTSVVTTSVGAEGMGLRNGETALIADDADEFAACVSDPGIPRA